MKRVLCALVALALSSGCVTTKEGSEIKADIEAIKAEQAQMRKVVSEREESMAAMIVRARTEIENLERLIKQAEEALRKNDAEAGLDMQETREELSLLRGRTEELQQGIEKLEEQLKVFREDVDFKIASSTEATEALPKTPRALLALGDERLKAGDHRGARQAYEELVKAHSSDKRVDRAIYGMGEAYYREGKVLTAIYEYKRILDAYPKSARLADATLRIGQGFKDLGKCPQAKLFFEKVVADYTSSSASGEAKRELDALESGGCTK
ncbi:MAG: tetratricopeptide repeat protein [Myxococcota bacterium]